MSPRGAGDPRAARCLYPRRTCCVGGRAPKAEEKSAAKGKNNEKQSSLGLGSFDVATSCSGLGCLASMPHLRAPRRATVEFCIVILSGEPLIIAPINYAGTVRYTTRRAPPLINMRAVCRQRSLCASFSDVYIGVPRSQMLFRCAHT